MLKAKDNMYKHFSKTARLYKDLRTTDIEPILFIKEKLKDFTGLKAMDIGCGAGRYDFLFFEYFNNLNLTCVDINESMLTETSNYLKSRGIKNFNVMQSDIDNIQLENNSMDCVLTFNAIHHFDFMKFIKKTSACIKENGLVFIYTRTKTQNARNIWGKYFPHFSEKEDRLYERDEMEAMIDTANLLSIEGIKNFKYKRGATFEELIKKVRGKHYSTFSLYKEKELEEAIKGFHKNIKRDFVNFDDIEWFDENILLILKG